MKDRLKFRAWDNQYNKMYYCNEHKETTFVFSNGKLIGIENALDTDGCGWSGGCTMEIMQCLGIKDKNERLIFEGDILQKIYNLPINEEFNDFYEVENNNEYCGKKILSKSGKDKDGWVDIIYVDKIDVATMDNFPLFWLKNECFGWEGEDLENSDCWEVIGNIYENKELLNA